MYVYVLFEERCGNEVGDEDFDHAHESTIYAIYKNKDVGEMECSRLLAARASLPYRDGNCKPPFRLQPMAVVDGGEGTK